MAGGFEKIEEYNRTLTEEERKQSAIKAGKASVKRRREKKMLKEYLNLLLEGKQTVLKDGKPKKITGAEAMAIRAFKGALDGDWKAWELVRDTAGQKPIEKVAVANIDSDVIEEVEKMVNEIEQETSD